MQILFLSGIIDDPVFVPLFFYFTTAALLCKMKGSTEMNTKIAKKILFGIYFLIITLLILLFLQIAYYNAALPDNFFREKQDRGDFVLSAYPTVSAVEPKAETEAVFSEKRSRQEMTLMLYGIIPIKTVTVERVKAPALIPSGEAFGLKMNTEGVMVTEYGTVEGAASLRSPAREGGILEGDVIISANGVKVFTSGQLSEAVQKDPSRTDLTLLRDGCYINLTLTPEKSAADGQYKLGIWTRDSCAGIGTLTYYDKDNLTYGGLGHSVCDADTGKLLPLASGETVPVAINGVIKGVNGRPGELCGTFMSSSPSGSILLNTECGIFGCCKKAPKGDTVPMAYKQEIEIAEASILTTVDGMTPKSYGIMIEKVDYNSDSAVKNMVIRVTDPDLLSCTGGIVQGMSGSPIIQNGKIIGAVTHVFVNDITRGYAIFAENMYSVSSALASPAAYPDAA